MSFKERITAVLFPYRCCICRKVINPGKMLCKDCAAYAAVVSKTYTCKICGTDRRMCSHKRLWFEQLAPAFFYSGAVRGAIARFKFRQKPGLAAPFAHFMAESMKIRSFPDDIAFITWIPMTDSQRRHRGYNQGELLARELTEITGIPSKQLLVKLYDTAPQHTLPLIRRHGGLLGVYEVLPEIHAEIKEKKILIADDVCTSGQTLNEAAKTLLIFGAQSVYCTCFAMTSHKKKRKQKGNDF